ncbi:UvrD-like helicase, ATP-binding domain, P-loop containing nucleoside triphosphate hydrolase [Tanacetum coccineum]
MKLFQNEQSFGVASDRLYDESRPIILSEEDDSEESKPTVLHQLFLTVSPKLCYAVKQHVSHLTSISSNGNSSAEINLDNVDVGTSGFSDIPDTFVGIPVRSYPLVITFHKFLMMLDGTLGNSFFERFHEAREGSLCNNISSRSVSLQTFIRLREVTFDRFCSLYWPHFNSSLTKKLDPSRVFTEIISHIKGGLQSGECSDGKLSYEDYCLLAETRSSTLVKQKRDRVYTLFQVYEKMKTERGEFDLGDLVNDIHYRLKHGNYIGDQMDFVYIDEVQDLSMRQISLFKYICQNVDEGFVFAGDTAQTIARGIDFRFQDIRSLFYKEFLSTGTSGKQEKGLVSEIFQLKQNFRTHAGVLELAQSVIDILYCYFAHSIDILEPETSLISGEAPVLLESGNDENAIVTIFGGSGSGGEIVGFGAEQVILVRDDCAKSEICECVGKHALVLTIVECKGLEFQDVLLYNFFGTSPLKDQWRVIYGYMKERDWLDEKITRSFPTFSESRHSVLCSELKQLYVAITRTRQRLWICENREELSKPMFDYWKSRGLVQIRKLDDSVAQAMRVASSPEEWRERGKKLFYESNFVMATMCFERARDTMWEKWAKASGLRASADQMRGTNPEAFVGYLRDAAGMFESIGKLESAALCYCDLGEYERAGKIYLHKCGKLDAAAQCFNLAGCYSDAAEAYAKGNQFSSCLLVCKKGKLFDKGLEYIECWKEHSNVRSKEIEDIEQEFLHTCALYYHGCKDFKSMMKFVRAFCSMDSKRAFLRSFDCLGDLLNLEEESGNFLDAAELASSWGDVLKEADLLEKAGNNTKATDLLLWYIFFSSVWGNGNRGWPLKQFPHKDELCRKVKSLAKTDSNVFYDFVCSELKVLSDQKSSLNELKKDLDVSHENKSLKGEILSIRKILDAHFHLNFSKYEWEDELPIDTRKHCEDMMFQNRVSMRTLVFYWNSWKENVVDIFRAVNEPDERERRKHGVQGNMVYLLVNKDADWIRNCGQKGLHRDGKRLTYDGKELVCAIRSYWQSELLSVGIKVLESLEALHKLNFKRSPYHPSTSSPPHVLMFSLPSLNAVFSELDLFKGDPDSPHMEVILATEYRDGGFIEWFMLFAALQNALEELFRSQLEILLSCTTGFAFSGRSNIAKSASKEFVSILLRKEERAAT